MTKSMGITKVSPCFGVLLTMTMKKLTDDTLSPLSIFVICIFSKWPTIATDCD